MLPIIMALPFGSIAKYCPGTIRLHPLLPKVSWCTLSKTFFEGKYSNITILPESEPTTM